MFFIKMVNDPYKNQESISNLVDYAIKDKQKRLLRFYGGYNVDVLRAAEQMERVKEYYQKTYNRMMRHIIVSFDEDITPYDAYVLGWQIAAYYADRYQIVFGVHEDTDNLHIHLVFNTVSFVDGLKYSGDYSDLVSFRSYVDQVVDSYLKR